MRALAVVGGLLSLGMVAVSCLLNFRFGYSLGADSEVDAWIYGMALVFMDGLKALMPFVALSVLGARHRLGAAAAWGVFTLATVASMVAALGFADSHRSQVGAQRSGAASTYDEVKAEVEAAERKLAALGSVRSSKVVSEARAAVLARPLGDGATVGTASEFCVRPGRMSRAACEDYATLGVEFATAEEAEKLAGVVRDGRQRLQGLRVGSKGVGVAADPQVAVLERLARLVRYKPEEGVVKLLLGVLFAGLVEVGSGLGLYLSVLLWRVESRPEQPTTAMAMAVVPTPAPVMARQGQVEEATLVPVQREEKPLGRAIHRFMMERLEPADGMVTSAELYDEYRAWCDSNGLMPLDEPQVLFTVTKAAARIGMDFGPEAVGHMVFRAVRLVAGGKRSVLIENGG